MVIMDMVITIEEDEVSMVTIMVTVIITMNDDHMVTVAPNVIDQ